MQLAMVRSRQQHDYFETSGRRPSDLLQDLLGAEYHTSRGAALSLCWYLSDGRVDEEKRRQLLPTVDTYELHPWTASSKFSSHERDELIVLFERVADIYIEADLLELDSELGAEIDTLRDLNRADDLSSPHFQSRGLQNCLGMSGGATEPP